MKTQTLRQKFETDLAKLSKVLNPKDITKIAADIDLTTKTIGKYLDGFVVDLETAETIIESAKKIIANKQTVDA